LLSPFPFEKPLKNAENRPQPLHDEVYPQALGLQSTHIEEARKEKVEKKFCIAVAPHISLKECWKVGHDFGYHRVRQSL
jgi:hypothetical protein